MPEEERDTSFDPEEDYPWDPDLPYGLDEEFEAEDD